MGKLKFIEMPREEISLDMLEQEMITAGDNCKNYVVCGSTLNSCEVFNSGPCSGIKGCNAELYCIDYKF